MSYSRRSRYSRSPSVKRYSRSLSRSVLRSRSRSPSCEVENPGNNLYVTGLSPRISKRELEKHFATEGKVIDVHLVVDPWTRESRGFGFVTMENVKAADRCIKYLNCSVLEGRVITVEKSRRRRGRTPTPGRYLGLRTLGVRRRTPSYSPPRRSPSYSPYRRSYSRSPCYSSDRTSIISYSPNYRRRRSYSPNYRRRRSYSLYNSRRRSYSPDYSRWRSYSPDYSQRRTYYRSPSPLRRSYSPYDSREYSPHDSYYGGRHRYRSVSCSVSPRARRSSRRSYSRSVSPRSRRRSRKDYSPSVSPEPTRRWSKRNYSLSVSPEPKRTRSRRSYSQSISPRHRSSRSYKGSFRRKYSRDCRSSSSSRSVSASSRFISRSVSPKSTSASP